MQSAPKYNVKMTSDLPEETRGTLCTVEERF